MRQASNNKVSFLVAQVWTYKKSMTEILMAYLDQYYWSMQKMWKNMCQNFGRIFQEISWQKKRFLQHVQKTEHVNLAWSGIPHAAQRKFFPKFNFFCKNSQKVIEEEYLFTNLHFLCHLIWPRWFNFLVHECLNLTRFCFIVSYALCIQ